MQNKIDEIMGLVEEFEGRIEESSRLCAQDQDDAADREYAESRDVLAAIESKLRELVRERDQAIQDLNFVVGITNTSEKQQEVRLTEQQSMEYAEKHDIALHRGEILILKGKSAQEWILLGGTNTSGEV